MLQNAPVPPLDELRDGIAAIEHAILTEVRARRVGCAPQVEFVWRPAQHPDVVHLEIHAAEHSVFEVFPRVYLLDVRGVTLPEVRCVISRLIDLLAPMRVQKLQHRAVPPLPWHLRQGVRSR